MSLILQFLETFPNILFFILFPIALIWCFQIIFKNKTLPPSPFRLPIIGNFLHLGKHIHCSLQSLSKKHGPLMLVYMGSTPVLVVSDADSAQEFMKTHDIVFSNRPTFSITRKLLYADKDLSLAPYGEHWRQMRSICVLQLLSSKRVQSFHSLGEEEVGLMVKKIERSCSCACPIDLSQLLASITHDVLCRIAFGRKYGNEEMGRNHKELMDEFTFLLSYLNIGDFIPWLFWLKYVNGLNNRVNRVFQDMSKFLDKVVDDHLDLHDGDEKKEHMDFVDVLLEIQNSKDGSASMGREYIKAIILDMFLAGTDTSYSALEWTMTELLRHPEIMKKTQKEIRRIVGSKTNISENDLEKMHYLKSVIKEALRLHPPVPVIFRETRADIKAKGYNIAAKTWVLINAWAISRDPENWNEPEKFNPERFVDSSIDFTGHGFKFIPFGSGRRGCPGTSFAVAIIELVLANLLHKFDWELPQGITAENLDTSEFTAATVHRKFPLVAIPVPPNSSCS